MEAELPDFVTARACAVRLSGSGPFMATSFAFLAGGLQRGKTTVATYSQ